MRGGAEVDDFNPVRLSIRVEQHDVLWLEVGVDQAKLFKLEERRENLLRYWPDVLEGQRLEFVLLEKIVKILLQHLKDQARVIFVREALVGTDEIELVRILLRQPGEDGHFDLALPRVRGMVFEDLDGDDLVGALFPALGNLPKGTTTQKLQYLILVVEGRV